MDSKQNKFQIYRQGVYDALALIDNKDITVQQIMALLDWPENKETNMHNVRESLRDLVMVGVITTERRGQRQYVNKTDRFEQKLIPNPWL